MKNLKKVLALVLAVVMIMGTVAVASAKDYSDVKADNDYAVAIDVLSNLGILDGFPSGEFKPEGLLTRAEAAKIVAIVHNSAIMGSVQSDVADLYKNAQNSFVDCNNSWALPYINYCRITGLADGMTATTYEPNRKLTGVQFLKLMLTTLNFDSAKEGFTGKGWDVNVLRRANEVGLTDGLADGWQGINELKRGEAAQILYNALTKYLVEYGQLVKNNVVNTAVGSGKLYYASSFISNEQVAQSGYTLAAKMGISVTRTTDAFRRPGWTWSHKSWTSFYMDTPIAEYKTVVSECDLLVAMGVKENDDTPVVLNGWVNGKTTGTGATQDGKLTGENAALNYYAVDGLEIADLGGKTDLDKSFAGGTTLQHDTKRECKKLDKEEFGNEGDLTQLFETEDGFVLTTIHTFLANVDKVNTNSRKTHATGETTDLTVYIDLALQGEVSADELLDADLLPEIYTGEELAEMNIATTAFEKDAKLNVTISRKAAQNAFVAGKSAKNPALYVNGAVQTKVVAESKTGKLTGASGVNYADTTSIDGTKYNDSCRFVLGKDLSKNREYNGDTFTFYFDTYGNVIGAEYDTTKAKYLVIDRMWSETPNGKFAVKADLVMIDATAVEGATIKFGPFADEKFVINSLTISTDDRFNTWAEKQLYTYTVEDGVYTLTYAGVFENWGGAGMIKGFYRHSADEAYIDDIHKTFAQRGIINISESTVFLCEDMAGKYTSYTGYSKLPALSAQYVDYVDEDNDGYADVMYLGDVTYAADKIIGFVAKWAPFSWSGEYDLVTVYVNGEATVINVPAGYQGANTEMGLYEFEMATDKDGNVYADVINAKQLHVDYNGIYTISADKSAIQIGAPDVRSIGLTGKALYLVNKDFTVEPIEAKDLDLYDHVIIYADDTGKIVALYILDFDPADL